MKRVLCLPIRARSRFVYLMSGCPPAAETIRLRLKMPRTVPYERFISEWEAKVEQARREVGGLDVFNALHLWSGSACDSRHVYTRYIVHGYHYLVCSNAAFHEEYELCTCRFCLQRCTKYHAVECTALDQKSLHYFSRRKREEDRVLF